MNRIERTIKVPEVEARFAKEILKSSDFVESCGRDEVVLSYSLSFDNGICADIKVCNGDGPFVDAVLFEGGVDVGCLEPRWELTGVYEFVRDGVTYVAVLEVA